MSRFVADASATMPWAFKDEASSWSEGLLSRVESGDILVVPVLWNIEVTNVLCMAERRNRISAQDVDRFLARLALFTVEVRPVSTMRTLQLARKHELTVYDAAYLEVALSEGFGLATLDKDLGVAAANEVSYFSSHFC